MNRKSILKAMGVVLVAALLVGAGTWIGSRNQVQSDDVMQKGRTAYGAEAAVMMNAASADSAALGGSVMRSSTLSSEAEEGRKIVRTAQMDIESDDLDAALAAVHEQVAQPGGTIDYSEIGGQKGEGRYASLEVRVPSELLDDFLSGAGSLGRVTRQVTQQSDLTAQYMDNSSRLESAMAQKQRLDQLFAQAQDMADIVEITDALFDVQQEIDSLTGANAWIDARASFAAVSLYFTEPADGEIRIPFLARLTQSLRDGMEAIGSFFGMLALMAAWALPWMALAALAVFAVIRIRKLGRK